MATLLQVTTDIEPIGAEPDSLVILCASYKERSTALVRRLSNSYPANRAVPFLSEEYANKGKPPDHLYLIRKTPEQIPGLEIEEVNFNIDSPVPSMQRLQLLCSEFEQRAHIRSISVDINAFPRQELLIMLRVLDSFDSRPAIRLHYRPLPWLAKHGTGDR